MFELLAAALEEVSEHVQESAFINGLKPDIRAKVRMMKSDGLREITKFAQRVEERNLWSRSDKGGGGRWSWVPKFGVGLTHQIHPYGMARGGGSCDPLAS